MEFLTGSQLWLQAENYAGFLPAEPWNMVLQKGSKVRVLKIGNFFGRF